MKFRPKNCMACGGKTPTFLFGGQSDFMYDDIKTETPIPISKLAASINKIPANSGLNVENFQPSQTKKSNPWTPYLLTRGAVGVLGEISGRIDRKRQDQYDYNQLSTLGQMNSMPVENFQPNPFSLYAKYGGSLRRYQTGGRLVTEVPKGYKQIKTEGNRTYYGIEDSGLNPAQSGNTTNNPAAYQKAIIDKIRAGVSPQELAEKKYIGKDRVAEFLPYYNNDTVYTERNPVVPQIQPQAAFKGEPVYEGNKLIGYSRFRARNSANQASSGVLNTQDQVSEFMFADNMGKATGDLYTIPSLDWSNIYTGGTRHLRTREGLDKYKATNALATYRKGGKYRG